MVGLTTSALSQYKLMVATDRVEQPNFEIKEQSKHILL